MTRLPEDAHPRFLADEGFNMDVAVGLRRRYPGLDLITTQDARLLHAPDQRILDETRRLDRILLSHDVHTMPGYFYQALSHLSADEYLPGVLLIAQEAPIGAAIEWIAEVWGASRHDEWRNRVEFLPI